MKLLFFTGARSEWGYIRPILELCKKKKIKFNLSVSNTHLLNNFGYSKSDIIKDGFKIDDEIFMTLDGYNDVTMAKSLAIFGQSFSDLLNRVRPDWVVLAGDRGETFMASVISAYMNIPIAHIQAGELSGNIDGQARHAIGKFAHLHFASNIDAAKRLEKLGEQKFRIQNLGAPQLDDMQNTQKILIAQKKLEKKFVEISKINYALCIFHPVVEEYQRTKKNYSILHNFLKKHVKFRIWISPNSDSGSNIIKDSFNKLRDSNDLLIDNLPRFEYISLLKNCDFIIGNSSSGIIESASFKKPCINIGRRQKNRFSVRNVVNIEVINYRNLLKSFKIIKNKKFLSALKTVKNPYGDGNSAKKILNKILSTKINAKLINKMLTY
tara:strand:+ start:562 stop:1704 length:1143 start_codon:yes stop_codon:yes gene_type:complete